MFIHRKTDRSTETHTNRDTDKQIEETLSNIQRHTDRKAHRYTVTYSRKKKTDRQQKTHKDGQIKQIKTQTNRTRTHRKTHPYTDTHTQTNTHTYTYFYKKPNKHLSPKSFLKYDQSA